MAEPGSLLQLAERVVGYALRAGAEQCDVFATSSSESTVTARMGELERFVEAGSRGLGLRVISGGRAAVASTSDLDESSLQTFAAEAVALAAISAPDACAGLPEPALFASGRGSEALQMYDESLLSLSIDEKSRMAIACERAAFAEDSRISNSDGATLATWAGEVALANSKGFRGSYPSTSVYLAVEVMAADTDGKKRNASWHSSERFLHRLLDPEEVGRIAARRAVAQIGARKVETRNVPVVFEPEVTAGLARLIAGCATGAALYRGATFLAGREGDTIGSPLVRILDHPLLPGRGGSRPFDGEGVATAPVAIIDVGVFRQYLFDVYTARRTGQRTTGSAIRGVHSMPTPGPSNLVWEAGDRTRASLIEGVREGLLVTSLMGFGFNAATGDFSQGAAGFWIRDGDIAFPVAEINISGRMADMLAGVEAVASDLTWFGSVGAPTIRIAEMTVSGL